MNKAEFVKKILDELQSREARKRKEKHGVYMGYASERAKKRQRRDHNDRVRKRG